MRQRQVSTIYSDHELSREATIRKFLIVQTEGSCQVEQLGDFYNLSMILAMGYQVRCQRGVQFRCWAISINLWTDPRLFDLTPSSSPLMTP